jgi:hypothetical protein
MKESASPSLPSPASSQRTNPWIIIVAVIILICCLCFGAAGLLLAFVPEILQELGLSYLLPSLVHLF